MSILRGGNDAPLANCIFSAGLAPSIILHERSIHHVLCIFVVCSRMQIFGFCSFLCNIKGMLFCRFLPESPRWLLAKNRANDAIKILTELARVNEKELPEHLVRRLRRNVNTKLNKTLGRCVGLKFSFPI